MKALIVGGTGFIGSNLAKYFSKSGYKINSFSRNPPFYKGQIQGVGYRFGDLEDKSIFTDAINGCKYVFHCASSSTPANPQPLQYELKNTEKLVDYFLNSNAEKFIYFSSGGAIYGNQKKEFFKETDTPIPVSEYGKIKLYIEKYLINKFKQFPKKLLILRPSNPYGSTPFVKDKHGVISIFLNQISKRLDLNVYGDGNASKDYIFIDDLVQIIFNLATEDNYGIYNIGSGTTTTINELISIIFNVTNITTKVNYFEPLVGDINFSLSIDKVISSQNHKTLVKLNEGIARLWKTNFM